ncbi:MAG: RNA degradosome polyphosphate kinase [Rickettsiales bacterium]|nr:RNA degradosome polyphosphate kinase [Rickettsiales bacterium]
MPYKGIIDKEIQELLATYDGVPYINRDVSWLRFNERVLEEAYRTSLPLLERLNFLAITASNLDEFFMVRIARIKAAADKELSTHSIDGLLPKDQLIQLHHELRTFMDQQHRAYRGIVEDLANEDILVLNEADLKGDDLVWIKDYFMQNIFPSLTPLAIDPNHPFPLLPNLGLAMVFALKKRKAKKNQNMHAIIPLPSKLPRFIRVPNIEGMPESRMRFILMEDVIALHQNSIFTDSKVLYSGLIRITRDSEYAVERNDENLRENFESALKSRRRGSIIRMHAHQDMLDFLMEVIIENLGIDPHDVYRVEDLVGLVNLREIYSIDRPDLKFEHFEPRYPERVFDFKGNCFEAIEAKDFVVHHPYESFDVVVRFLMQAASDPAVVSIKHAIYRTSNDSPIVKALIEAAEAGKSVTVLVELKARFDEETNIRWSRDLERAGAQVVYTASSLKMHGKISLVVRKISGALRSYVHVGTGNYHPMNAKVYSDLSYFTCDETICRDIIYTFNYLTGYSHPSHLDLVIISPLFLREKLIELISQEIKNAEDGKPAGIWAKFNSLADKEIINHLYRASYKGVKIKLFVRGICCLKPGIKGLSENIEVKSIVGRFLEHARIVCFANGHELPSPENALYISSADWMTRNFDERVEIMLPIHNSTVHEQILGQIMVANMQDEQQSWVLDADGNYTRCSDSPSAFSAHEFFMTNPSLSGRGKALKNANVSGIKLHKFKTYLKSKGS